jgi:phosphatidylinositol-3-phosphatase
VRLVPSIAAVAAVAAVFAGGSAGHPDAKKPHPLPRLQHVVVVIFENEERRSVLGSGVAPTFDRLAADYAQATNYRGVAHPSLPNYLALVSGSTHGVADDCTDCPQTGPTIGTQLTARRSSWAAYAEGYPSSPRFAKKHVPFLYFPGGSQHVFDLSRLNPRQLPAYSLVIPDLCNDMHDCSVSTGDQWLSRFIKPLLAVKRTAVFIVFDEGTSDIGGGGNVPLIVAGSAVKRHSVIPGATTHYSLLRTTEALLGLRPLGRAASAPLLTGIWR